MEWQYTAFDKDGQRVSAIVNADSTYNLSIALRRQGMIPLSVKKAESPLSYSKRIKSIFSPKNIKGKELVVFSRQLSNILKSGVLLTEALSTISDDMENAYFGNIIRDIEKKIVSGSSFSQALSFYPKVFSHTFVAMVKSGENVGNLGNAVSGLAEYLENLERMKEKIKGALRYPVFILCFMILIVSAIVVFIIPKFNVLFKNARVALPLLTRVVVGISEFIIKHAVISFGFLLLVAITFRYLLRFPKIRLFFDQIKLEIPFVGKIIRKNIIARFSHALGMLLAGEVGVISALSISNEIISNVYFKQIVENIKKGVSAGFSLSESLGGYKIMPRVLIKMVEVGEKTGGLDSMLKASARYYDEEIESTIDNLSTMIEPVFIAVIGFMVLVVALALYLPIFKLSMTVR